MKIKCITKKIDNIWYAFIAKIPSFRVSDISKEAAIKRLQYYLKYYPLEEWLKTIQFHGKLFRAGALVFDVGSNTGNRIAVFDFLDAQIVAVEPQSSCFQTLTNIYGSKNTIHLEKTALGAEQGEGSLKICSTTSVLSSLSDEWIEKVKKSGRFEGSSAKWEESETVPISTLDKLIEKYGVPEFIKIDVEGFEAEVLKGLSTPVPMVSIEFIPEDGNASISCIDSLAALGNVEINFSEGESKQFFFDRWRSRDEIIAFIQLAGSKTNNRLWGDFYIRSI